MKNIMYFLFLMISTSCFAQQSMEEVKVNIDKKLEEINKKANAQIKRVGDLSLKTKKTKKTGGIQYVDDNSSYTKTSRKKANVNNRTVRPKRVYKYNSSRGSQNVLPYHDQSEVREKTQEAIRMQNAKNDYYILTQPFYQKMSIRDHENATTNKEILNRNLNIDNLIPDRGTLVVGDADDGYVTEEKDGKDMLNLLNKKKNDSIPSGKIYYLYRGILMIGKYKSRTEAQLARKKVFEEVRQEEGFLLSGNPIDKATYNAHVEWLEENLVIKEVAVEYIKTNDSLAVDNATTSIMEGNENRKMPSKNAVSTEIKTPQNMQRSNADIERLKKEKKNKEQMLKEKKRKVEELKKKKAMLESADLIEI